MNAKPTPKRANLRPPGKCIFCDSFGVTKEHMWADWLRNYVPREMAEHHIASAFVFPNREEEEVVRRNGDPHSRKIKCVCGSCNNGWMSKLQEAVKPFLVPMLMGENVSLHRKGQTKLAAWTAMMVMVAEYADRDFIAVSPKDRHWLLTNLYPPSHWRIWIGRHSRETYPLFSHRVLTLIKLEPGGTPKGPIDGANTQTSTICLGKHLIIHVMSSRIGRDLIRRWPLPPKILPLMTQIWPIRTGTVAWPRMRALCDREINLLADQFLSVADRFTKHRMTPAQ